LRDYVQDVAEAAERIMEEEGTHPVLGGWSLGGLVSLLYTQQYRQPPALLLVSPSPPLEIAGQASEEELQEASGGVLTPGMLGIYPDDLKQSSEMLSDLSFEELLWFLEKSPDERESGPAYRERLRGVSVPPESIQCTLLVVYGEAESDIMRKECAELASQYHGDSIVVSRAGHWGIICSDRAVMEAGARVSTWLDKKLT
jgi:pimeloyl-ACP methyl ester carboxylesterase